MVNIIILLKLSTNTIIFKIAKAILAIEIKKISLFKIFYFSYHL